jgi:D-3-phosphoglycerate dehydrogenase
MFNLVLVIFICFFFYMNKVLASPSSIGQISRKPFDLLEANGYEVITNPYGRKLTEDEVIEIAHDCIGIVAGVEPLTDRVMGALKHLKCISRVGVGMDSVDLDAAQKRGITVVNTPDGPTQAVAEMTLGMTMALLRRIPQAHHNLKQRIWKKETGNLLVGKRIGVIGLGRIGRKVSEIFRALGNEVIGFDLFPDKEWAESKGVWIDTLFGILGKADIITLHVPPAKDGPVITSTCLAIVKDGTLIVNASRGGVVDEKALLDALVAGKLGGLACDVFSEEPYDGPLCDLDNVVLTPHLGSYAKEGKLKMEIDAVENLIKQLK